MIKRYNQYIKESREDIDPYGEEIWEDVPRIIEISLEQGKPLDKITKLECSNNQLTSLEGIEKLVNLEILYCFYNQLTTLEGIEKLVNLKILYCYNNQLTSLE